MSKEISLTRGQVAIVDDADYEWLSQYKWYALKSKRRWYAVRKLHGHHISMHCFMLHAPPGMEIDHINGNGCDNRRENQRICTRQENTRNQRPRIQEGKTSKYRGVCWYESLHKWRATITVDKRMKHLGYFKYQYDAVMAYDIAAIRYYRSFARPNLLGVGGN